MADKAVIIGTGAGGLMAAASLAHAGYEVTALERGKQLGGFLNPFARKHYQFDPGVHYIGRCRPGEQVQQLLEGIGVDASDLFCEMDRDGFDVLRFPDFEIRVCAGLDAYLARLIDAFERDSEELERYFDLLRIVAKILDADDGQPLHVRALSQAPGVLTVLRGSFQELLETRISNPRLRSVLAAQCGDAGLPPSRLSALTGLGIMLHFAEGAFFPRGGSERLRDVLVDAGRAKGASYRRNAEVTKIHVEHGRVTAVELASGERIDADIVVSAIDPTLTYGQLLDPNIVPDRMLAKVHRTEPSLGSVCLFYGLERDLRNHGMSAANVWDYPSWDLEAVYNPLLAGRLPERDWAYFLSPNSLKDDTHSMAPEGCSTLEVVTLAPFEPFARFAHTKGLDAEYGVFKTEVCDRLQASIEDRWPGLIGDVVFREDATPLTNIDYVNAPGGAVYGPAATPEQSGFKRFRPWTPISGLFLAGSGVLGVGVVTCMESGALAATVAQRSVRPRVSISRVRRVIGEVLAS